MHTGTYTGDRIRGPRMQNLGKKKSEWRYVGLLPHAELPPRRVLGSEARVWSRDEIGLCKSVWGLPGDGGALPPDWSWPLSVRGASEHRKEGTGDLIRPGGLWLCGGLWDGERKDNSSESLCCCSILAGHLGEAGRSTEGRVRRRLSGWGWEDVRAAEGGRKALSESLDGHQPDVETIWRRRAGGGHGGEEDKIRGGELGRASEASREDAHLHWPRDTMRVRSGRCSHTPVKLVSAPGPRGLPGPALNALPPCSA